MSVHDIDLSSSLVRFDIALQDAKSLLAKSSRTAKLWLQYLKYIDIVKTLIRAERTGDWNLHLVSVFKILHLFAATGHNHYAKSARLYLQLMLSLRHENPCLYDKLSSGYHSVRRSDRYWAGLSTDLVIEQTMMKSLKGRGGLTHGRGMTESMHTLWVYSVHECASIRAALASLAGKDHSASPHVELGKSHSSRDFQDLGKILQ